MARQGWQSLSLNRKLWLSLAEYGAWNVIISQPPTQVCLEAFSPAAFGALVLQRDRRICGRGKVFPVVAVGFS